MIRLCVYSHCSDPYGTATKSIDVKDGMATGIGTTATSSRAEPVGSLLVSSAVRFT